MRCRSPTVSGTDHRPVEFDGQATAIDFERLRARAKLVSRLVPVLNVLGPEPVRDVWSRFAVELAWGLAMSTLFGHVRYGVRMLIRRPGLSVTAVVALALGIGLTTTMFSIVYAAVIRGLPYDDPDRLVALFRNRPAQGVEFMGVSIHDFEDWRAQQTSFEDIAAYFAETVNVGGTEGEPIRYLGAYASARMFEILRVQPVLGRVFRPEEDHPSTPPVMLLSYRAWQDRFQGDPAIVGRTVRANAEMTTIVGVMPEKFGFPAQMDAWLPLRIDPLAFSRGGGPAVEGTQLQAVARLKPGVSVEAAQAEMAAIADRTRHRLPRLEPGHRRHGAAADRHLHRPAGRRPCSTRCWARCSASC